MRLALLLARRGYGRTSPNPMVGAVLVKGGQIIGQGWHRRAGKPHAEIEAIHDAQRRGNALQGSTLYVTLEPCCTYGRTPPCTDSILSSGISRIVVGAVDPNPRHSGKGLRLLRQAGVEVMDGVLAKETTALNEAFNHWIVHGTPFVTVKAAMSMDGKIATVTGESQWISGENSRKLSMKLRRGADAILAGVNTILTDDPGLTLRNAQGKSVQDSRLRRIVLDAQARTPLGARVVQDDLASLTTIVVSRQALADAVAKLRQRVQVWTAPARKGHIDLGWLLKKLGQESVTSLLVEGGGEVHASFLLGGWAHRVVFFYAPKILGGREATKAVAGTGAQVRQEWLELQDVEWSRAGEDLVLRAQIR